MKQGRKSLQEGRSRLWVNLVIGALGGVLYIATDTFIDARLGRGAGLVARVIEGLHRLIDEVLPILAGGLLGVALHYLAQRKSIAEAERRRAEDLDARLNKVERDQAVWVVAAALLHDLKTPLHTLGLLLDELDAPGGERERAANVERCRAQVSRLVAHVDSLKSLPITDKPVLPEIALGDLVSTFVEELGRASSMDAVRFRIHAEPGVRALAAPSYVRIVLETLIENAVDVLRERGHGEVSVDVCRSGDRAVIRVRDDGPGIPAPAVESIFEPLRTTKVRGLGLGLAIARALSRAMKGDLALERSDDGNTTFRVELCAP